jgi:putative two-component system hydrogenase maturation factor HypX/HoxX
VYQDRLGPLRHGKAVTGGDDDADLLIASAYNSMTQRVHAELADRGHEVSIELALGDEVMRDGVRRYDPDLIIAPMLTRAIPADIWSAWPCFIVHPGPMGDGGPSSLDWAIMVGQERWGVTVLQANAEMDAGDIWASVEFAMPGDSKSSTYRTEVADAAVEAVLLAVARFTTGRYRPEPLDYGRTDVTGQLRPPCRQPDRTKPSHTPPHLARHRTHPQARRPARRVIPVRTRSPRCG